MTDDERDLLAIAKFRVCDSCKLIKIRKFPYYTAMSKWNSGIQIRWI